MTWLDCQRQFLTAAFWKALRRIVDLREGKRWRLVPLLFISLLMVFAPVANTAERFADARDLWIDLNPSRKRPGATLAGYLKALERLPWRTVRGVAPLLRQRFPALLEPAWRVAGWIPFGIDGTTLELPRTAALQKVFADHPAGVPHLWLTCVVHVGTGVPWSWRYGAGTSNERAHLLSLQPTLPPGSLLLADAGFVGHDTWKELHARQQPFLMRVGSLCNFYIDQGRSPQGCDGRVWSWRVKRGQSLPVPLRLIRLPGRPDAQTGRKADVWLVTNVLDSTQLSRATAGQLYRLRWENEVFFRSYKRTLGKAKLSSQTPKAAVREAELSMVATQLLLAQTGWALQRAGRAPKGSLSGALRQWRAEWKDLRKRGRLRGGYLVRLARAHREARPERSSPKSNRGRPGKERKPPGAPRITTFTPEHKAKIQKRLKAAQSVP